jgi:hypothetical protein
MSTEATVTGASPHAGTEDDAVAIAKLALERNLSEHAVALAKLAIRTLDAQQRYFKTRSKDELIHSKELERQLRARAGALLDLMEVPRS